MERTKFSQNPNVTTPKKKSITQRLGDAMERVGEKLSQKGARGVGQKIYKAGDKLEHSGENRGSNLKH